jgi:hypothetical protein
MLSESLMLSASATTSRLLTIVAVPAVAVPKPMMIPMLVTMAAVPPKLNERGLIIDGIGLR